MQAVPQPSHPAEKRFAPAPHETLLWTDGSCLGNPGPGGWAAILLAPNGDRREMFGSAPDTTNNRMEYTAAIEGLLPLPDGTDVLLVTDSKLMFDSMTSWLPGWKRRGFKTAAGKPVKNRDLVIALEHQLNRHNVRWHWVKAHETGPDTDYKALNDHADRLARQAAIEHRDSFNNESR